MSRRYHARLVALSFGIAALFRAAGSHAQETAPLTPLQPGAWALQFRVGNDFTLDSFKGGVLSVKHHSSARTALRLGLSTSLRFINQSDERLQGEVEASQEMDADEQSVALTLQRLKYLAPEKRLTPFWGVGPFVSWSHQNQEREIEPELLVEHGSASSWSAGLTGNLGVEWCPTSHIGIHAEYGLSGGYSHQRQTTEVDETDTRPADSLTRESNSWFLYSNSVLMGVSAYF
ncbi:MAG TPA: hypothetical protein VF720_05950 [Candidatus Eisenbacteria bacterium]